MKNNFGKNYFRNILYQEYLHSQRNKKRLEEILQYKNKGKLFEVGFGEGNFLKEASKYFDVGGVDVSSYAAETLKNDFGSRIRVGDIQKFKLKDSVYDVVVAFNVFEHLIMPTKVINELYKSLKASGVLIGSVPNNSGIFGKFLTTISNIYDRTHVSTYHPRVWEDMFLSAGFSKIIFIGENSPLRNYSCYIRNKYWRHISFNLIFVCIK